LLHTICAEGVLAFAIKPEVNSNRSSFIMIQPAGKKPPAELHVVVNWSDELKARLGAARN